MGIMMNHFSEWSDGLSQGVWLFVRGECLNRDWMEFVVSHGAGPLTLVLIHLTTDKPDWKPCWLLSCRWKQVWYTCTHFLCTNRKTNTLAGLSRCWLSHKVDSKYPSLQQTLRSLLSAQSSIHRIHTKSFHLCLSSAYEYKHICPRLEKAGGSNRLF